ncbi:MAG: VanZ family protein [Oscillospiraceae bacterium]|nr:VanZ family protein [Oscillospiraceae bacterium]
MKHRKLKLALFAAYCLLMLVLLFGRALPDLSQDGYWETLRSNMNLKPFETISNFWEILRHPEYYTEKMGAERYAVERRHAIINLAGNVIMFVPLGFFPPAIWTKLRALWKMLLLSAGVIIAIEAAQLFSLRGSCDTDDLILNLLGVAIGYGLFRLVKAIVLKKQK